MPLHIDSPTLKPESADAGAPENEIAVTDAMIDAGWEALKWSISGRHYDGCDADVDSWDTREIAEKVIRSALAKRRG